MTKCEEDYGMARVKPKYIIGKHFVTDNVAENCSVSVVNVKIMYFDISSSIQCFLATTSTAKTSKLIYIVHLMIEMFCQCSINCFVKL